MSPNDGHRHAQSGFTLIEMMVALAVFGLAALALLKLVGVGVMSAGVLDRALVAQIVAQNTLVDAISDPAPAPLGSVSGAETNAGAAWRWTRTVSHPGDARLLRIDVTVTDATGRTLARATGLRLAAAAMPS